MNRNYLAGLLVGTLGGVSAANAANSAENPPHALHLQPTTVTATREAQKISEIPASVVRSDGKEIAEQRPRHPSELLNRMPGVRLSHLSGEGHSTSIRQPLTTAPVYLFLEDGIPTRSTGFFNHNALYEINVPQAAGIEVNKGPGSALYGSDAIGGIVNVLTPEPPPEAEYGLSSEIGGYGWKRLLLDAGDSNERDGFRASLNLTRMDGWQHAAGYDRQSALLRWDRQQSDYLRVKTVLSYSQIDQAHVGSLNQRQYRDDPQHNNIPFSGRQVEALRISSAFEHESGNNLLSFTPYFRDNSMDIVPSWSVSYDPSEYTTANRSFGFLSKYRLDFEPLRTRLILGLDYDYSPGSRQEDSLALTRTSNAHGATDYRLNQAVAPVRIYDYDVTFQSISPYLHGELSPSDKLRLTAGLRYDQMEYDYRNRFNNGQASASQGVPGAFPGNGWYGHAGDSRVRYRHLSPKLGATYAFTPSLSAFVAYSNAFRAPSESQVFRGSRESNATRAQAAAEALLDLKPVLVDSYEIGLRGYGKRLDYQVSLYQMTKKDDILSYQDPLTNQRRAVNAGETLHRGIELGLGVQLSDAWRLDNSMSYAKHSYEQWSVSETLDYSGKEMEAAPRLTSNSRLNYAPAAFNGGRLELEWQHLGSYWRDADNTSKYGGHDLLHLRGNYLFDEHTEVFASLSNLLDKQYAETSGLDNSGPTYSPGLPRNLTVGVQLRW
nr:TonB-dependent receptor [uncultured Pseudomonas sp.]